MRVCAPCLSTAASVHEAGCVAPHAFDISMQTPGEGGRGSNFFRFFFFFFKAAVQLTIGPLTLRPTHSELRSPASKSVIYANSVGAQCRLFINVQLAAILMLKTF